MIHSIKLTRFKQFKETEVRLQPFSILMGENNSGKTTVLQALWLALSGLHQGKLIGIDRKTLQTKISSTGFPMYEIPFVPQEDFSGLFYKRILREGQTYDENSGALLEIMDEKQNRYRLHLRELFRCLNFKLLTTAQEIQNPTVQNYAPLFISGFSGLHFQEERLYPAILEAKISSGDTSGIIRNIILDLKQNAPEKYHYMETLLDNEFGFRIKDIRFQENDERYVYSEYEEREKLDAVGLEFGSSGSGMMQILQIISVILRYCPEKTKVVLIDEPEMHLHENLQIRFVEILRKMQQELGIQMILSTHSSAVIRNAEPEEVIPMIPYAPVNKPLRNMEEGILDAYTVGKTKISGKLIFMDRASEKFLKKKAKVTGFDGLSGVNTVPVIIGWRFGDQEPFETVSVLKKMTGRTAAVHLVCMEDSFSEEEKTQIQCQAQEKNVTLTMISSQDGDEILQNVLDIFKTDEKLYRTEEEIQPEQPVRRREYEQMTLLDL